MATPFVVSQDQYAAGIRSAMDLSDAMAGRRSQRQEQRDLRAGLNTDIAPGPLGAYDASYRPMPQAQVASAAPIGFTPPAAPAVVSYAPVEPERGVPISEMATPQAQLPSPRVSSLALDPSVQGGVRIPAPAAPAQLPSPRVPLDTMPAFDQLVGAVVNAESGGDPYAVSPKGAKGIMQVMDGTAKDPGFGITPIQDDSLGERARVGRDYLAAMLSEFGGNLDHALAAYNWGPGATKKWVASGADPAKLPAETRNYISTVRSRLQSGVSAAEDYPGAAPIVPGAQAGVQVTNANKQMPMERKTPGVVDGERSVVQELVSDAPPKTLPQLPPMLLNAQLQEAMAVRPELTRMADLYRRSGNAGMFYKARAQLQQLDAGLVRMVNERALNHFRATNDPSLLSRTISQQQGRPVEIQPRTDGTFQFVVAGQVASDPISKDRLLSTARQMADSDYAAGLRNVAASQATEAMKAQQKLFGDIQLEIVKGKVAIATETLKKMGLVKGTDGDYYVDRTGQAYIVQPSTVEGPDGPQLVGRLIPLQGSGVLTTDAYK